MRQISIFAENRKGTMHQITDLLAKNSINILGSVTNDSAEYGIIRMVVSDTDTAMEKLQEAGFMCRVTDVLGAELEDEVGNLNNLLKVFLDTNINVNYIYLSFNRDSGKPILIIHTDEVSDVRESLTSKGFTVL